MTDARAPHQSAPLSPAGRAQACARLAGRHYDVLVVGGGVTGAGVALDAAARGLKVGLVEMRDWAAGTSSRSGKLIHGGLRYLEQLNFRLVRESLRERRLLLTVISPHLVHPIRFVYPLRHGIWERLYVGAGLVLYDTIGGAGAVPRHRHLSRRAVRRAVPGLKRDGASGALTFSDAQLDDARHTVELVRTACAYGVDAAAGLQVVELHHDRDRIRGARLSDLDTGESFDVSARHVVNATGAWGSQLDALTGATPSYVVRASKGVHITVPRDRIDSKLSMFVRAEDSVLFVRSWGRHWLIGTTDTPWTGDLAAPTATANDIDYLLRNVNAVLERPLTRDDIDGVYSGLRPLVVPRTGTGTRATSSVRRDHIVEAVVPGYTSVLGGKYTTYRVMARDAVDAVERDLGTSHLCTTADIATLGARGLAAAEQRLRGSEFGRRLGTAGCDRLLARYGSLVGELSAFVEADAALGEPLPGAERYLRAEVVYAATHEGARHLDDVLERRTHIAAEYPDRGVAAAPHAAALLGNALGWHADRLRQEVESYREAVAAALAAEAAPLAGSGHALPATGFAEGAA